MKAPKIAVIIIHYSSLRNVRECLSSLQKSKHIELIPIVVDNAARESAEPLTREFPGTYVLRLQENTGFTGGNNRGISFALKEIKPDSIVLLNDDTTVDPLALSVLHQTLHSSEKIGAVVPKIYFTAGKEFHHGYSADEKGKVFWYGGGQIDWEEMFAFHRAVDEVDRGQYELSEPTPFATGCCVALKPHLAKKLRGFDDRYFLYWEDTDLSLRIQKTGHQTIYQPKAVIWHKNAGSSGSGSALHEYYQTRNRYLFGFRFAPLRTKLFLLKQLFVQFRSGNQAVRRAILDFVLHRYGKRSDYH